MLSFITRPTSVGSISGAVVAVAAIAVGGAASAAAVPPTAGSASVGSAIATADRLPVAPATDSAVAPVAPAPADPAAEQAAAEAALAAAIAEQQARDAAWHTPAGNYTISSYYGEMRSDGGHYAIDLAGPEGQDVFAARTGTVISAGWQDGYGFTVEIDHGDGHTTLYGHLMTDPYVAVGQHVTGGQPIGALGTTGYSTGPHLHLELEFNGALMDPSSLIPIA